MSRGGIHHSDHWPGGSADRPGREKRISERRTPKDGGGGTGDLLAGAIGGLMAQGMPPWPAARLGCALLREAGERAAGEKGPGLLAEDVPVHIAHTLSDWTGSA